LLIDSIISIIFTEAITELCVKSELFSPVREWFFNNKDNKLYNFIHSLLTCGYCFSVWAAALSVLLVIFTNNVVINTFILVIVVHRLSNVFHFIVDRFRG